MYVWMLLGFSTVLSFWEIYRLIRRDHQDQDLHAYAYQASENHSFGSHDFNINTSSSSVQNSSCNDSKDLVYRSDPSRIQYDESYTNLSISTRTTTTKKSEPQSEYGNNKSTEGTKPTPLPDQSRPYLSPSSSLTSDQPPSSFAKAKPPANASESGLSLENLPSSKPTYSQPKSEYGNNKSREGTKPTPSSVTSYSQPKSSSVTSNQPRSSSVKAKSPETESQSPSSFKKPSSSKLIFSPLPSNSRNQATKAKCKQVVQQDTSPSCMIPKGSENLIKKENVADVLEKLLSLAANKDYVASLRDAEDFYDEYHTRAKTSVTPILELNFLGLPIRPGEKDCPYYMSNGLCKHEANCKFNHPNPIAEGDSDSPLAYANGGSISSNDASQASVGSWSSPRTLNETSPFVPMMISPNPLQNSEWNGCQDQDLHAIESHASNIYATSSSVHNSSHNDSKEPSCQLDGSRIYYHERYPNVSNSTSSTQRSRLQSEYGNNKSVERTKPAPPSPDQSKPVLSQPSSVDSDEPRSSSAKAKPPATKYRCPSSLKPSLSPLPTNSTNQPTKANCKQVVKDTSPICVILKDIENLIKKGVVPDVLKKPLSQSTYKDYFAALLYAEDFYIEKWNNFQLLDVTLEFHEPSIDDKSPKTRNLKKSAKKDKKIFVALKIDSVPARPIVLPRDFVFARKSGSEAKTFQGIVYRLVKSNLVLVAFQEEFYSQHNRNHTYDVSFSFNGVWLKRAHQAVSAAVSCPLLEKYLFPEHAIRKNICSSSSAPCVYSNGKLDLDSNSAIRQILSSKGHLPYLVEGPLCASSSKEHNLSKTGLVVREAVLQIFQRSSSACRILICSPVSSTGDILLRSLKSEISESVIFRANVAFGEVDEIPGDVLPSSVYQGNWSFFPSLKKLKQFRVIFSTFVGSFRLFKEGITAQHFSHIFLVDASSVTEPETMIPLSNLANDNTTVILTGAPNNQTARLRSDIARKNGLRTSYFERLRATKMYKSSDSTFITRL